MNGSCLPIPLPATVGEHEPERGRTIVPFPSVSEAGLAEAARPRRRIVFSNYDSLLNPFYSGGGARAVHHIAKRMALKHEVTFVTGAFPGCEDHELDGVRYEHTGSRRAGPKLGQLLYQFSLQAQARRRPFDYWVESFTPPFSTACLPLFTRRPVIGLTQLLAGRGMAEKYHLPFATAERAGLKTYNYAVAHSSHVQRQLLAANARLHTRIIPNGVEQELIDKTTSHQEDHILFLGRLDIRQKGLDLLLDAFARTQGLRTPLVIAGSGSASEERWLMRRIGKRDLAGRVRFIGRVEGREKEEWLRRATLLVMPSRFEGSPLVLMEAFCHQVPVVAFDIPDLSDWPSEICHKVPPLDSAALGRAIGGLAADHHRRRAMGAAAKEYVRRFNWEALTGQYEHFFESILAGSPALGTRIAQPALD